MQIKREKFLRTLELVKPGLSPRPTAEQTHCLVFSGGDLCTFDGDQLSIRMPSGLPQDFVAAVRAKPLLAQLPQWPDEIIGLEYDDSKLTVRGKYKGFKIGIACEVKLPLDKIEAPDEWHELPAEFSNALKAVIPAAGKDDDKFVLTCVHMHPEWVECFDQDQLARQWIDSPFAEPVIFAAASAKYAASVEVNEVSLTPNWVHFRCPAGVEMSCRRYLGEYPQMVSQKTGIAFFDFEGEIAQFPKSKALIEAAKRAAEVAKEETDHDKLLVELAPGKVTVRAIATETEYWEYREAKYDGPTLGFLIHPELFAQIIERFNEFEFSADKLKVVSDDFVYVASLVVPRSKDDGN